MQNVHTFAVCQMWSSQTNFAYISQYSPIFSFFFSLFRFFYSHFGRHQYSFDVLETSPTAHTTVYISFICRNAGGFCVKMTFINIYRQHSFRGQMAKSVSFKCVSVSLLSLSLHFTCSRSLFFLSFSGKKCGMKIFRTRKRDTIQQQVCLYI